MTRSEIPTPALLLDLDRFERNIQKTLRCACGSSGATVWALGA